MRELFTDILNNYLTQRSQVFKENYLANKIRDEYSIAIQNVVGDKERYKVVGSPGKGQWTDCPWIAIFDIIVTSSAQSGFYPVYLFKEDMSGFYLSLNQGVTTVEKEHGANAKTVLAHRSAYYRSKIKFDEASFINETNLGRKAKKSELYELGNIICKYYPKENIPKESVLVKDLHSFLNLYQQLVEADTELNEENDSSDFERKKLRLHKMIERRSGLSDKVKKKKGYKCEACDFEFKDKYGSIGKEFIEAHHLTPISQLNFGKVNIDLVKDFAVLCSNCHRMIHRLDDPSDLSLLRKLISINI